MQTLQEQHKLYLANLVGFLGILGSGLVGGANRFGLVQSRQSRRKSNLHPALKVKLRDRIIHLSNCIVLG